MADFWIDVKKVPLAELDFWQHCPASAKFAREFNRTPPSIWIVSTSRLNGMVLSLPDHSTADHQRHRALRGSYFTDTRRNEVHRQRHLRRQAGLHPGQWIHLLVNNRREELFIVGTAISSEFVYLVGPGSLTPDPRTFRRVLFEAKLRRRSVRHGRRREPNCRRAGAGRGAIGRTKFCSVRNICLSDYGVFSTTPRKDQPSNRFLSDEIRGLGVFAQVMPVIFLAVAAMVLNVVMVRLIDQQRSIVGTLESAWAIPTPRCFGTFMKFGGLVGLCGGLVGLPMGYGMATFITSVLRNFFEFPHLENVIYPDLYLQGLVDQPHLLA